ncbi:NADH-quinone oxidoreductase subunit N [Fulvivirga sedimenti]|uniref:NADH-quinone oxidoreductase subunit N n=1 Tax=Fulvivirga sedimenti TaxID=2879465 RepID=A0A9X1HWD0_9BACT|nr:NADH-quinone oxidoreductase subunit N [Fulvivirga sedimenti]MCA6075394.1 NADH-quinone oxidoreductase subunit N [Fulvivirga sedimenti]MCA6076571.1 NADH-quinone oxidoreductase subunit N [Fulvivirga sedimenti]MCA6077699.1 NADH-quinone oxidoreductase subunit N [Fulvivirga sedimenti]
MKGVAQILDNLTNLLPFLLPEVVLAVTILLVTVSTLKRGIPHQVAHIIGILGILVSLVLSQMNSTYLPGDWFTFDESAIWWKTLLDSAVVAILLFRTSRHLRTISGEYVIITLMMLLGAHFLVMANHLFLVYLSVEIMSLSGYMLVALPLFRKNIDAGFKYLVFGAVSSALMLYGISLFYGLEGNLSLAVANSLSDHWSTPLGYTVLVLISFGLMFKVAAVPFHIWVPDVYEATPMPVITLLSTVPKVAAIAFLLRWTDFLTESMYVTAILAGLSMLAGNFGALRQQHMKRMMGFSAIAHTGFMLAGLLLVRDNPAYVYFYAATYVLMTVGAFHLLNYYEIRFGTETLEDMTGASAVSGWKTVSMVIWMIALTGLPPTAGFTAKLFLFGGLAEIYSVLEDSYILWLLLFAVVNAVISLAYYLKIPYYMIFRKSEAQLWSAEKIWTKENFLGTILVLAVLIIFFKPEWLMGSINSISFVP